MASLCDESCYDEQRVLEEPMPLIGGYIAAASAVLLILMVADTWNVLKSRKFWFPCKYFSLNTTSLTLLTVAMKFIMDISSIKNYQIDFLTTFSSFTLMSTSISNFMISLASMDNNGIMLNLSALVILIVTVDVNIFLSKIQEMNLHLDYPDWITFYDWNKYLLMAIILILIILLCSSAVMVPTTKRCIQLAFQEKHKIVSEKSGEDRIFRIQELTTELKKCWVIAVTGNPQFVMARSVVSVLPGFICLFMVSYFGIFFIAFVNYIRIDIDQNFDGRNFIQIYLDLTRSSTSYRKSVAYIFFIQVGGVFIGSIAPIARWVITVLFRSSSISIKNQLKIASHCIQTLIEWKESPVTLPIRHRKCKQFIHVLKSLVLIFCLGVQICIFLLNSLVLLLSWGFIVAPYLSIRKLIMHYIIISPEPDREFSPYVLLLEFEPELPTYIVKTICKEFEKFVQIGETRKPTKIIELVRNSENLIGTKESDSSYVAITHFQELPKCWSLAVATLTKIAISLPSISNNQVDQLMSNVSECISFVKFIEKTNDMKGQFANVRKAGFIVWGEVELYRQKMEKGTLQDLSTMARKKFIDFKSSKPDSVLRNPHNWPPKVIAANSMYRIRQTISLAGNQSDLMIFEQVSTIVSNILAASLKNLPHALRIKCQTDIIEKREESIQKAAIILGESKEVIEFLAQHEWRILDPETTGSY